MKARRKGDTAPFDDVYQIVIGRGLNAKYIPINDVEFEQDHWQDHWQDVRERAAISAMQIFIAHGWDDSEWIVKRSIRVADALVKKLKGE